MYFEDGCKEKQLIPGVKYDICQDPASIERTRGFEIKIWLPLPRS